MAVWDGYEVDVPVLEAGVGQVEGDAGEVGSRGAGCGGALGDAGGACGGGPLSSALASFEGLMQSRSVEMRGAVSGAAVALGGNAETYRGTDADAARGFSSVLPSAESFPSGGLVPVLPGAPWLGVAPHRVDLTEFGLR